MWWFVSETAKSTLVSKEEGTVFFALACAFKKDEGDELRVAAMKRWDVYSVPCAKALGRW